MAGPMLFRMGLSSRNCARFDLQQAAMWVMLGAVGAGPGRARRWRFIGRKHRAGIVAVLRDDRRRAWRRAASTPATSRRRDLPPINDVQTDWTLPVAFTEAALKEREKAGAVRVRDDAVMPEGNGQWTGMPFARRRRSSTTTSSR